MKVPFHKYWFGEEEEQEVIAAMRSGWITTGPRTCEFEKQFSGYLGISHAVGVNSCTAALHIALEIIRQDSPWEVIVPSITFAATANTVIHAGGIPVFADVDPDTLLITAETIAQKITSRTRAVIAVHLYGQPCEIDKIKELCDSRNLILIEDCAHSIETLYHGKHTGTLGDMSAFSFYATKNITTAEGGMFVTNSEEYAEKAKMMRLHGMSRDAWKRYGDSGYKHYYIEYPGFKYNMFDLQAALGLIQLKKINRFHELRSQHTEYYTSFFKDIPGIYYFPEPSENTENAYHLYPVMINTEQFTISRDQIMNMLIDNGVNCALHFAALHLQPYYMNIFGYKPGDLPVSEHASQSLISLPFFPKMETAEIQYCAETLIKILNTHRR